MGHIKRVLEMGEADDKQDNFRESLRAAKEINQEKNPMGNIKWWSEKPLYRCDLICKDLGGLGHVEVWGLHCP